MRVGASANAYPSKGQSPDQQKKDESACHTWAARQSGFDASTGAAVGAVAARGQSRRQNAQQQQQQQQASAQQAQSQQAGYGKARAACLEGRGYTVK